MPNTENVESQGEREQSTPTPQKGNGQDRLVLSPMEPIKKPGKFSLDDYRSDQIPPDGIETLQMALPVHNMSAAKDWVKLHPDETYWSPELCFVNVPIKGQSKDQLHIIKKWIAARHLAPGKIAYGRLVLATKPYDVFFLCRIPTRNLDNSWNETSLRAAEQAKTLWTQVTSLKSQNIEDYKVETAANAKAFPEPRWPTQDLAELIGASFPGRNIDTEDHPALLRLTGDKLSSA
jgi:hypothetical protein